MYLESLKLSDKNKKYLSALIKLVVLIAACWIIYTKTNSHSDFQNFVTSLASIPPSESFFFLGLTFLLMFLNWGLEASKWKYLLRKIEPQTYWRSVSAVFCGLTWAVFTPNRLGEYGGRVFFLRPARRLPGVFAMAIGSFSQMVVTNVFGLIASLIFIFQFQVLDQRIAMGLGVFATLTLFFFLLVYFNINLLHKILLSFKWTRKFKKIYAVLARYSKPELFRIISFSLLRYAVFSLQYVILFAWLVPEVSSLQVFMLIAVFFFVQSYLPSLDLLDLAVRSITGLYFFNLVSDNNSAILACFAIIWFTNIIIPAILGSYFVLKLNFFGRSKTYN